MAPRIPYVPSEIEGELPDQIRKRRNGELLELDRTLLHNQEFASGWNQMMNVVRTKTALSSKIRELVICWIAVLNKAWYEWDQHAPLLDNEGVTAKELQELMGQDLHSLTTDQRSILTFTSELTQKARVSDDTFDKVKAILKTDVAIHDLVAVISSYNMVSRYLNGLQVGHK